MKKRTLLGFDYGTKRIGVAVGQEVTYTARPLTTLNSKNNKPAWHAIEKLIKEWHPDALIVGIPSNMDDTPHEMTTKATRFSHQLQGRYQLPIYTIDERLTSAEAEASVGASQENKAYIDQVAAQIILQAWLNQEQTYES